MSDIKSRDPIQPTKLYTPREAAIVMGISNNSAYKLVNAGKIRSIELGHGKKILGENLLTYLGSAPIGVSPIIDNN